MNPCLTSKTASDSRTNTYAWSTLLSSFSLVQWHNSDRFLESLHLKVTQGCSWQESHCQLIKAEPPKTLRSTDHPSQLLFPKRLPLEEAGSDDHKGTAKGHQEFLSSTRIICWCFLWRFWEEFVLFFQRPVISGEKKKIVKERKTLSPTSLLKDNHSCL